MKKIFVSIICVSFPFLLAIFIALLVVANQYSNEIKSYYKFLTRFTSYNSNDFNNGKHILRIRILNRPLFEPTHMLTFDRILKERYNLIYVSDNSYDLVIDGPRRDWTEHKTIDNKKAVKFFYTEEAETPNIQDYDLSIGYDHIDNPGYIRIPYVYVDHYRHKFHDIDINYDRKKEQGECNPKKPIFACMLVRSVTNSEGARKRPSLFYKLSLYKDVSSGGMALNNIGYEIAYYDSMKFMSQCKFVIAYENKDHDGYITEKVFQAYFSGAMPIYYGNRTVMHDINKQAIIYEGDFKTENELVDYIKKVDQDDELYCKKWNQNIISQPEKSYNAVYTKLRTKIFEVLDEKLKQNK